MNSFITICKVKVDALKQIIGSKYVGVFNLLHKAALSWFILLFLGSYTPVWIEVCTYKFC